MEGHYFGVYKGETALVTGRTGFMGAKLPMTLNLMGAGNAVVEFSLGPPIFHSMYDITGLGNKDASIMGVAMALWALKDIIAEPLPDFVFHLAAQLIVLESHGRPVDTFSTTVMGTMNFLESLRNTKNAKSVVVAMSDKSHKSRGWEYPYSEVDEIGGKDPYSSSKSCADVMVDSYRESCLKAAGVGLSSNGLGKIGAFTNNIIEICIIHTG